MYSRIVGLPQRIKSRCVGRFREWHLRRVSLRRAPAILEDTYGIRFIRYPWDRHPIDQLINRDTEHPQFEAMSLLVHPGDLVLDVGAHTGFYSVIASRMVGPTGSVYAFEPVPDTYWNLREVLALNRCDNVIPLQQAICDKRGTVMMNLFEPNYSAWNTLGTPTMSTPEGTRLAPKISIEVPSDTLDDFTATHHIEQIAFLKVDVEGFERSVFSGAHRLLSERRINYICFEISQEPLRGAGATAREIFAELEAHGYIAFAFNAKTRRFDGPVHDSTGYWANYFASYQDFSSLHSIENTGRHSCLQ